MSSGKKQGEILCFDLAYILFADQENLPCLHFLLNDKKELMHDNQLIKVAEFVQDKDIQLVVSILRDKLPEGVIDKAHVAVELSQDSKLFKIESDQ
ncbi:ATPase involved in DNA repair [Desulfosporosinus sp. I2]|nr:ATPase involved in DNA repair [Desulfosporosinus sp. I2]